MLLVLRLALRRNGEDGEGGAAEGEEPGAELHAVVRHWGVATLPRGLGLLRVVVADHGLPPAARTEGSDA